MNGWKISCQLDQSGTDQSQVRLVHTRQFSRLAPGAFNNCFPLFWLVPWLDCVDCVVIGPQIFTLPMWQFFTAFYWKLPGEVGEHYFFFFFANCQVTMFNIFQQYWTINMLDDVKFAWPGIKNGIYYHNLKACRKSYNHNTMSIIGKFALHKHWNNWSRLGVNEGFLLRNLFVFPFSPKFLTTLFKSYLHRFKVSFPSFIIQIV